MDKRIAGGWWLLAGLLFGCASATGVLLAKEIEHRFGPVVSHAVITRTQPDGDGLLIWGTFDKDRDCHFVEAVATAGAISLDLEFRDDRKHRATTRPTGPQVFGPWRISPTLYPIRIEVRHECHPWWFTSTVMIEEFKP